MIGAIAANVVGNMVSQPLLGSNASIGSATIGAELRSAGGPISEGYASSAINGILIGIDGKTVLIDNQQTAPESNGVVPASGTYSPMIPSFLSNKLGGSNSQSDVTPNGKPPEAPQVEMPPAYSAPDMQGSMLIGAVAGAIVAKQAGYSWLIGALGGALVGHVYAGGAA